MWRLILMGLLMLECTIQKNLTQRDSGVREMEIVSLGDMKISEQTDIKKSIIVESCSKEVQNDFLSSQEAASIGTSPFKRDSSPLNESDSKFGQMEDFDIDSPEKVDSEDLNLKLRDSKSKPDHKILTSHKKAKTYRKFKSKLLKETEPTEKQETITTFRELRGRPWFIDVTRFIYYFHLRFRCSDLFISPIKSGKTTTIDMLREFYCVPRIDVKSYNPEIKPYFNTNSTAKDIFKGTSIYKPEPSRTKFAYSEKEYESEFESDFVEENMNQYPVIVIDFQNVRFDSKIPTEDEINRKIMKHVIQPAFEQYDYLLFITMAKTVCRKKYGKISSKTYRQLFEDLELDKYDNMREKINVLWNSCKKEELIERFEYFYKVYTGNGCDFDDIQRSLEFLVGFLLIYEHNSPIILVDNHDVPTQRLFENTSFLNLKDSEKLMKSIDILSRTIASMFQVVGRKCDD
jgi:hypothetical protein